MDMYTRPRIQTAQQPPPVCPKCGSHRTEVIGFKDRSHIIIRCGTCGERSVIALGGLPVQAILEPEVDEYTLLMEALR